MYLFEYFAALGLETQAQVVGNHGYELTVGGLALYVADRIAEDEADGFPLLKKIQEVDNVSRQQTA